MSPDLHQSQHEHGEGHNEATVCCEPASTHEACSHRPPPLLQRAPPLDGSDFVCVLWTQFQGRLGTVLTRQGDEQMLSDVEKYCSYPLPPISMLRKPVT